MSDLVNNEVAPEDKFKDIEKGLQEFVFQTKYARWIEDKKRRETWEEAVDRVQNMHLKKFDHLEEVHKEKIKWAFSLVKNKELLPSMRSLQFGGKAIEVNNSRIYNCLRRDTTFITDKGVKSFIDFQDGDTVKVLTHKGLWQNATVKCFGKQKLQKITFKRSKAEHIIYATENHRWLLKDGSETTSLKEGDNLLSSIDIFSSFEYESANVDEKLYWAYGYIYGDGTLVKDQNGKYRYSMVRLCDDDGKFLKRFEELGFSSSSPLSCEGDSIVYTGKYLKTSPNPEIDSPNLIRAFVRGYLDADGHKNSNKTGSIFNGIQSSDLEHINFIRKCFPIAGIYIISETELTGQETNLGIRPYTIRFNITNYTCAKTVPFYVSSIESTDLIEDVWCLEVENDHSFVFPFGLTTGNCCVRHLDSIRAFAEIAFLMLCGTGTGIGLRSKYVNRLPNLIDKENKSGIVLHYTVEDTIEGWADSLEAILMTYFVNTPFSGRKIVFDYSKIRRKGTRLKTGGGKAPGYRPLKTAHERIRKILEHAVEDEGQYRLKTIQCMDILLHFADAVLSGGIRRTASSIIFDYDDEDILNSKTNFKVTKVISTLDEENNIAHCQIKIKRKQYTIDFNLNDSSEKWNYENLINNKVISWHYIEPQRGRSNNSVVLNRQKTTKEEFARIINLSKQWGEPGFVWANDDVYEDVLYNPCFEIAFVPVLDNGETGVQFCNLTSINGTKVKDLADFLLKVEAQTIIGTLQATYTDFNYLNKNAKILTESEALLGNSIMGLLDNPNLLLDPNTLNEGAKKAVEVNSFWAKVLGINPAARINCEKPEGTGSLAVGSRPGAHAAHYYQYFRRIQIPKNDNIYLYFKERNPHLCEESVWNTNTKDDVVTFPVKAPEGCMVKQDLTALEHLDIVKTIQKNWILPSQVNNKKNIEHNVSITIIMKEEEWDDVIDDIYENRNLYAAISFISDFGDKAYAQAPFEKVVTQEDFDKFNYYVDNYVPVDYSTMVELQDDTNLAGESSCSGGACVA